MAQKGRRVIPNPLCCWAQINTERAPKHFGTKKEAMEWSRDKAKSEKSELIPHERNGKIQNSDSYRNDPNPLKDEKH